MAYGQQNNNSKGGYANNRTAAPAATTAATAAAHSDKPKVEAIFSTGLFAPTKPGVRSMGSVQLKESVTIPAGSYINLYPNDKPTSDKSPAFRVVVTPGNLKAQK